MHFQPGFEEGGPDRPDVPPRGATASSAASEPSLRALIDHSGWVEYDAPLEAVHRVFEERQVDYLALARNGMVTGLCSRLKLGIILGSRFGYALYGRSPAYLAQVTRPLVFAETMPVREILDRALGRPREEFLEDVVLVDAGNALLGLVPVHALARLQTHLMADQYLELQQHHDELLAADNARRQSQGRYAGLFESHTLGVALLDTRGSIQSHNRRLAELFGLDHSAELASLAAWVADEERQDFVDALEAQSRGGTASSREFRIEVLGRGMRLFRCSLGWIGETQQVCVCLDDITDQRVMERQLASREKQTLLDTLVGGIAHELNNKLTPIQGFSELIETMAVGDTRNHARLISKSVREAATIIRQLLQLSKPTATVLQHVELKSIVEEALSVLTFKIREASCRVSCTSPVSPVWVRADPAEIKQVVINLVLNAVQAMEGRPAPGLDVVVAGDGNLAKIVVVDHGVGIPPENIERIFDPFFTTKGPERGTGLGLSVCISIVRKHGGDIAVESRVGEGSRFTVSLPLECAEAPVAAQPPAVVVPQPRLRSRDGARVLVVDDEPQVRRLIGSVLTSQFGCEVDTVPGGMEALERLATGAYALVLSDVSMATMPGTEIYLWLREAQPVTAGRFVFVTGYSGANELESVVAEWRVPVLRKPFTIEQLRMCCSPFLEHDSVAEAIA